MRNSLYDFLPSHCLHFYEYKVTQTSRCKRSPRLLACRRSGPRQQRHRHLNDIIDLASTEARSDSCSERASGLDARGWQTTGRHNNSAIGERKTAGMGCHRAGHLCRCSRDQFSQGSRSGGRTRSYQIIRPSTAV